MLSTSLYIIACSTRNRIRVRLRRLREPRYLVGAVAGAAYMYFSFFGRFRARRVGAARRGRNAPTPAALAALAASGPALVGLAFMVLTGIAWIMPFDSGLLDFSKAEVQFLFPAPVHRRSLLLHRMLRSQIGMLFGAVIVGLVVPSASGYARLRVSLGMWLLMCTGKIYFTGVALARARLGSSDARVRRVAWFPLTVIAAALVIVGVPLVRAFLDEPIDSVGDALARLGGVAGHGVPRIVMAPFMALAWPLFAPWPRPYVLSLAASAAVLAVTVVWVLRSDETFYKAAQDAVERKASQRTEPSGVAYRVRGSGLRLAATGRPETLFAWKTAMQTLRVVDKAAMMRMAAITLALTMAAAAAGRSGGFAALLGGFAMAGASFAVLMAPQVLRVDMRQDLQHLELLKTWPVAASAVVRGELLWPGLLLTGVSWLLVAVATVLSAANFSRVSLELRLAIGAACLVIAPALVFAQLTIHNGVALIFPAWVPAGSQRPRGLDAMGQRLILLGGTWLLLLVMAFPGALAGAIVWFAFRGLLGPASFVAASLVAAVAIGTEVLVATEALGPIYERLDILAVEPYR